MSRLNVTLEDLETFIAIADAGSFSLAASRLGVSQPTVTTRIKKLEDAFGVPLLLRTTRRVEATPAGARLRENSEVLLLQLNRLRTEFRGEAALACGTLSIGATPALAAITLPQLVARFAKDHPGVSVRIHDEKRRQTLADLSTGLVDLAIVSECQENREFDFEPLFATEFYVIGPANHDLAKKETVGYSDLAAYPLLTMPLNESIWSAVATEFERRGLEFRCSFEATGMFTALQMVDAGLGLTLLPGIGLSLLDPSRHFAVRLAGSRELSRQVGIARVRGKELSPSARAFCHCIRKWARDQLASNSLIFIAPSRPFRAATAA